MSERASQARSAEEHSAEEHSERADERWREEAMS
jgi:hypothetical protein